MPRSRAAGSMTDDSSQIGEEDKDRCEERRKRRDTVQQHAVGGQSASGLSAR